jgi:hypothetical protein
MLLGELALLQRLGVHLKAFCLSCSPGCQRRALNAMALMSQSGELVKQQASPAADFENSAFPSH